MAHGPNFAMASPDLPYLENITAIELACQSLNTNEAVELRGDICRALRHSQPLKPNLRKEEWKTLNN